MVSASAVLVCLPLAGNVFRQGIRSCLVTVFPFPFCADMYSKDGLYLLFFSISRSEDVFAPKQSTRVRKRECIFKHSGHGAYRFLGQVVHLFTWNSFHSVTRLCVYLAEVMWGNNCPIVQHYRRRVFSVVEPARAVVILATAATRQIRNRRQAKVVRSQVVVTEVTSHRVQADRVAGHPMVERRED